MSSWFILIPASHVTCMMADSLHVSAIIAPPDKKFAIFHLDCPESP